MAAVLSLGLGLLLAGCGGPSQPAAPPDGMALIPGGTFRMGSSKSPFAFEGPAHDVTVDPFYLDTHEVTNAEFAEFVRATGHVTAAERDGSSVVFNPAKGEWGLVDGASWHHPEGRDSSIQGKEDHPVVHVTHGDAEAYARWAGKRLPTEAEWEFAARGGLEQKSYFWGDELQPGGKHMANTWQGPFPKQDRGDDGFRGRAPVGKYPPNGYQLYDMAGNVWEWVHDRFSETYYQASLAKNPTGPAEGDHFVIRGGSFLCAENFCQGYRAPARNHNDAVSATNNTGFRCARDAR